MKRMQDVLSLEQIRERLAPLYGDSSLQLVLLFGSVASQIKRDCMSPWDKAVVRRKLEVIVENLRALEPVRHRKRKKEDYILNTGA